jgi:hypothetical protein
VYNTASGYAALNAGAGSGNSGFGVYTLEITTGYFNSAFGFESLVRNTSGGKNSAVGANALFNNSTANQNTAVGDSALYWNTTGSQNTAVGSGALFNGNGSGNIGIGYQAGQNLSNGSNNINIGSVGAAGDDATIRIGTSGAQVATYIAGITRTSLEGLQVVISKNGQLGVLASSERYKSDIESMGSNIAKLRRLRPVTFRFKANPLGTRQYGLIAEEVEKIYPELVIRDDEGKIQGVRYDELAPLLLHEVQLLDEKMAIQSRAIAAQAKQLKEMHQQFAELLQLDRSIKAATVPQRDKAEGAGKL